MFKFKAQQNCVSFAYFSGIYGIHVGKQCMYKIHLICSFFNSFIPPSSVPHATFVLFQFWKFYFVYFSPSVSFSHLIFLLLFSICFSCSPIYSKMTSLFPIALSPVYMFEFSHKINPVIFKLVCLTYCT